MKIILGLLVAAAGLVGVNDARAFTMSGAGHASCGTWVADRRHPDSPVAYMDVEWMLGFLSGVGYAGPPTADPLGGLDGNAVATWIDNYCQAHPLEKIIDAGAAFYRAHPHP